MIHIVTGIVAILMVAPRQLFALGNPQEHDSRVTSVPDHILHLSGTLLAQYQ